MVSFIHRVEMLATEWHSLKAFTGLEAWEREQDKLDELNLSCELRHVYLGKQRGGLGGQGVPYHKNELEL